MAGDSWYPHVIAQPSSAASSEASDNDSVVTDTLRGICTLDDLTLLRGLPCKRLLLRCGSIFSSSCGTAADYDLSKQVSHLDVFLSHNWSTPRCQKFLLLAFYYNMVPAVLVTLVWQCVMSYILVFAYDMTTQVNSFAPLASLGVFLTALLLWHEVAWCVNGGPTAFLDKACVHQTDPVLKRKGIESLAAYLCKSKQMVVIYSDIYLQRLWTVYELATFLLLHSNTGADLHMLPVGFPAVVLVALFSCTLQGVVADYITTWTYYHAATLDIHMWSLVETISTLPAVLLFVVVLNWWAREQQSIKNRLEEFDIRQAKCHCESDRDAVHDNVVAFLKRTGHVGPHVPHDEALAVFNNLVRTTPRLLAASVGGARTHYRVAILANLYNVLRSIDVLVIDLYYWRRGLGGRKETNLCGVAVDFVFNVVYTFTVVPLVLALAALLTKHGSGLKGPAAVLALLGSALLVMAVWYVFFLEAVFFNWYWMQDSATGYVAFAAACATQVLLTVLVYGRWPSEAGMCCATASFMTSRRNLCPHDETDSSQCESGLDCEGTEVEELVLEEGEGPGQLQSARGSQQQARAGPA